MYVMLSAKIVINMINDLQHAACGLKPELCSFLLGLGVEADHLCDHRGYGSM